MRASYWRITPEELENLRSNPEAVDRFFGSDIDKDDTERGRAFYVGLLESGRYLGIDQAWHGIHFLLTGDASLDIEVPPLSNVVVGGESTGWAAGVGDVRALTPQEVREVSEALREISRQNLLQSCDIAAFSANEIYPFRNNWDSVDIEWLLDAYDEIVPFFCAAADARDSMLLMIN